MTTKKPATPLAILKAARDLLSNPKHWTTGAFGRAADGRALRIGRNNRLPKGAVCWCADGALLQVSGLPCNDMKYNAARSHLCAASGNETVFDFNDHSRRTHRQILNWFGRAIKIASSTRRAA